MSEAIRVGERVIVAWGLDEVEGTVLGISGPPSRQQFLVEVAIPGAEGEELGQTTLSLPVGAVRRLVPVRHVVPESGGWAVTAAGGTRAISHHRTKADAVAHARKLLIEAGGGDLVVRSADGRVRDRDSIRPTEGNVTRP